MAKMIHSMIRVLDDEASIDWYRRAFGLEIAQQLDFESFRLTYLSNDETGFELELTLNKGRTEPYELGDGYGHLAVAVDDVDAEYARMQEEDISVGKLIDFAPDGEVVARFFFVTDPDGYKIEVLQRAGRYQ